MPRLIQVSESVENRRRIYFHVVGEDGITPADGQEGGQPQISTNAGDWTDVGIGLLEALDPPERGRYAALLTVDAVSVAGDELETRYKANDTAECPGDSVLVVDYDPIALEPAVVDDVLVDHDYGGVDELAIEAENGSRVSNAIIRVYRESDYSAGRKAKSFVVGETKSDTAGRWREPLLLTEGDYTLVVSKPGYITTRVVGLTVSSS